MLELALQVSQVAGGSSIGRSVPTNTRRMWTRYNGWEEEEEEGEEEEEEEGEEEEEEGIIRLIGFFHDGDR